MEDKTFEELLSELQKVVEDLESGKKSLEESVELYKKGMALSVECRNRLEKAKEAVIKKVSE